MSEGEPTNEQLRRAIASAIEELCEAYRDWDADRDHRVGKRISNAVMMLRGPFEEGGEP